MEYIEFPQQTAILAKDQPEYTPMPVYVDKMLAKVRYDDGTIREEEIDRSMTACIQFSDEEIAEIIANKKIFYRQHIFGKLFQPIFMSTKDPFIPENAEHWPPNE